uniref:flagellin N-terminal helical domain-containing protein n=1 Tax=Limnohabitans sp. TaxID=1907725 RepID=UPI00404819E9
MSIINTNIKALVAQNSITTNNRAMSKSMEQLSTGQRINSAADDAAGLAIASRMTSYTKGLNQAVRNANDGISLLQTAEGAMVEITNMLQRMRELAVQSGNDSNTSTDRGYLQLEFAALRDQITSVAKTTQWNGMGILDGSNAAGSGNGTFIFQVGANNSADQRISHTISGMVDAAGAATTNPGNVTTTYAGAGAKQKQTLTFSALAAGETIKFNIGGNKLDYTVTAADKADFDAAGNGTSLMVQNIRAALLGNSAIAAIATATASVNGDDKLVIEGAADAASFSFSVTPVISGNNLVAGSATVATAADARTAVDTVTTALATVSTARAGLGATINRLTYTADNVTNIAQNTAASRSRILDTDYAIATTELARTQIISQAATAMLAQANQASQGVLALLR